MPEYKWIPVTVKSTDEKYLYFDMTGRDCRVALVEKDGAKELEGKKVEVLNFVIFYLGARLGDEAIGYEVIGDSIEEVSKIISHENTGFDESEAKKALHEHERIS